MRNVQTNAFDIENQWVTMKKMSTIYAPQCTIYCGNTGSLSNANSLLQQQKKKYKCFHDFPKEGKNIERLITAVRKENYVKHDFFATHLSNLNAARLNLAREQNRAGLPL